MSATAAKASRRDIRRAFGAEFQEAVETFMQAHEQGLRQHGLLLNAILLGPWWKRALWLVGGARLLFWVCPVKPDAETPPQD